MSSRSDENGASKSKESTFYALLPFEKKTLQEARTFASKCGNKITDDKKNFAGKSWLGLWWDAKGLFKSSKVEDVTDYMERCEKIYEELDAFSAQVEEGDENSYERLLEIYKEVEEMEKAAENDVDNVQSKAACKVLREFLENKYKLDHNLKKVECVVLKQTIRDVEQSCRSSKDTVDEMYKSMVKIIEENREMKRFMETVKKQNDDLRSEADKARQESEEKVRKAVEEANKKAEARMQKMADKSDATLKKITQIFEDRYTQ